MRRAVSEADLAGKGEIEELSKALVSIELSIHYSCSNQRSIGRRRRTVTTDYAHHY